MNPSNQLRFAINDRINDAEVRPSHVPLTMLGEFQKDVSEFLKGANRDVDPSKVIVSIEEGSLTFVAYGLLAASSLWTDLEHLKSSDSLSSIDSKRASVLERWQSVAQKNPHRRYTVKDKSANISFEIDSTSNFHRSEDAWVQVEKYLYGTIVDMGDSNKANVHLKLENGETLTIAATQKIITQDEQNRLYRPALLYVGAEENLVTRELRNLNLVNFEAYQPSFDDKEFNLMVEKGTKAWTDVPNATVWVENLRGNHT